MDCATKNPLKAVDKPDVGWSSNIILSIMKDEIKPVN